MIKRILILNLLPLTLMAHTGPGAEHGFSYGLHHPLGGLDHLFAMVAVGLWAAQTGGRSVWMLPGVFVAAMLAGAGLGMAGMSLPGVEPGIVLSVLVLGGLIAFAARPRPAIGFAVVGGFALFHGIAHGVEMPVGSGAAAYMTGFVLSTLLLLLNGCLAGLGLRHFSLDRILRLAGAGISLAGLWLVAG